MGSALQVARQPVAHRDCESGADAAHTVSAAAAAGCAVMPLPLVCVLQSTQVHHSSITPTPTVNVAVMTILRPPLQPRGRYSSLWQHPLPTHAHIHWPACILNYRTDAHTHTEKRRVPVPLLFRGVPLDDRLKAVAPPPTHTSRRVTSHTITSPPIPLVSKSPQAQLPTLKPQLPRGQHSAQLVL